MRNTAYLVFIFLLIFSPLAFGATELWAITIMESGAVLALLVYFIGSRGVFYQTPGLVPLALFLSYILVQLLPLPAGVIKLISPAAWQLYQAAFGPVAMPSAISLSIDKKATIAEFFRFSSYAAFYVLTIQLLVRRELLKKTVTVIVVFAALLALLAIIQKFTSAPDTIYWFRYVPRNSGIFGPYARHDSFSGLMEMLLPTAAALFFYYRPQMVYKKSLRARFAAFLNRPTSSTHLFLGFTVVVIASSILICLSRGGILSMIFSMLFLTIMLKYKESLETNGGMTALYLLAIILAVSWFGWGAIFPRFDRVVDAQGRLNNIRFLFWRDSLPIIRDFPITGTGFGTFGDIFPKYKHFLFNFTLDHALNDYIELFIEGGITAFLLVVCFLFVVFRKTFQALAVRRERYSRYLFWGGLSGLGAIFIHSVTDYNLHVPANGLYFFFIIGLTVSAAHTRLRHSPKTILAGKKISSAGALIITAGLVILLATGLVFNISSMAGKYQFAPVKKQYPYSNMSPAELAVLQAKTVKACRLDPLEAKYQSGLASLDMLLHHKRQAFAHALKALERKPANAAYLQQCGFLASENACASTAELLLKAGINNDSSNPWRYYNYALWLFDQGRRAEGQEQMRLAMTAGPDSTNTCIKRMLLAGLSDKEIAATIPMKTRPALHFARYLDENGKRRLAGKFYRRAAEYTAAEKMVRPYYFYRPYNFFMKQHQYDDALQVMQKATVRLPDNVGIRITIASLYDRMGIRYRAVEEYQKALILDPYNRKVKRLGKRLNPRN